MANPNPSRITDPMWRLWTDRPVAGWRLGGIFANKSGYHNTVSANLANWPGNYSIRFALDTQRGPRDKSRAIDYTMSDSDMRKYTKRLVDAAARNDPRMRGVREFYGTLDSRTVTGRIRDNDSGAYRASSADASHLWHIHISVWAAYCNNWAVLSGIISILRGESLSEWMVGGVMLPSHGDSGPVVEYWQRVLVDAGFSLPQFGADGDYGDETANAVKASRREFGAKTVGDGKRITAWNALRLQKKVFAGGDGPRGPRGLKGEDGDPGRPPTMEEIEQAVTAWLESNKDSLQGPPGKTPTRVSLDIVDWE